MIGQSNRRQFVQATACATVGFWVSTSAADDKKERSPLERLNIACIGVGGKGSSDTDHAGEIGNVVALCDIDEGRLNEKAKKFDKARKFTDFRELLEKMEKDIDAVVVATPDHTHAPASAMAIRMGKHVYCQKPLTHSVHEARTLRELAREYKVCTQMGNQGTASGNFRTSVELLRSGVIGNVREVHVWTNRPVWPQSPKVTKRPPSTTPPKHVHWDLFLGPAPERPYAPGYHPFAWRGWWDFGTGALGDMACHTANMPFMGLRLGLPTLISAESEPLNDETYPGWAKVVFEFPARGSLPPVKLTWYEGRKDGNLVLPPLELLQGKADKFSGSGSLIVGDKVTIYSPDDYGGTRQLIGKDAGDIKTPEATLPRRGKNIDLEMKREWAEAIKKNNPQHAMSNFDYAATLTEAILLGNAAIRAGKQLTYDGKAGKFLEPETEKLLRRDYRTGWKL